jgi:hypothetical protein
MAASSSLSAPATPLAYTPVAAATVTGRTRTRIFLAIKNGELKARKDGKATLIEHAELVRWVANMPMVAA